MCIRNRISGPRDGALLLVAVFVLSCPGLVTAQDDTSEQFWVDYHMHYYQNASREFYGDLGARFQVDTGDWQQFYARPSIRFHKMKHFDIHLGIGGFYTNNQGAPDGFEIRPFQGIKARWPKWGRGFTHYFRIEERFQWSTDDSSVSTALRLRYKLATRIPLSTAFHLDQWYIPISGELFRNVGDDVEASFRSRARFDVGIAYIQNRAWLFELHFIVQGSASGPDDKVETSDLIFRFQLKHLIDTKDYITQQEDIPD